MVDEPDSRLFPGSAFFAMVQRVNCFEPGIWGTFSNRLGHSFKAE